MKFLKTFICALLFSTFFYKQSIGLNLLLFTITTILLLTINNATVLKNRNIITNIIAYLITGITVFLYKSDLTIIANILAFFTLVGGFSEYKSSIYVQWINGIYTTIVSAFTIYFDTLNTEVENTKKKKTNYVYWLKIIGIPATISIIFINLYRNGNPKFDELISNIDFSFINLHWMLFMTLGYYLFYNISNPIQVEPATALDLKTGNYLDKKKLEETSSKKLENEKQMGIILLISLNILIILFIITDGLHLFEIHKMTAPELSQQVHTGVNALIFSNLLAIAIILYFFRGSLNFMENNKNLKILTYIWISLNIIVIIITGIKNIEYFISFGLTYKRIGVLFFLTLTAIGLITTFIKVSKIKNLWFLFRKNLHIAFVILIISSTINWDKIITYYNINNAEQLDIHYLINLSNNNAFLLKDYVEKNNVTKNKNYKINEKHRQYIKDLKNNSWQEIVFDNIKIQ